jgi:4,5-DOPA dioxygenase extradiol
MTGVLMPAAFVGHGSPMNTLERNCFTNAWRLLGQTLPRPRAILAISAHWYINATAVTAMEKPGGGRPQPDTHKIASSGVAAGEKALSMLVAGAGFEPA